MADAHVLDPDLLWRGVPHDRYRALRRDDPVSWQEPESGGYWALARHEDVVRVSRDPERFSSQVKGMFIEDLDGLLPTLLNLDPPGHGEVRRPLIEAFSPRMAKALEPRMRALLGEVFDGAAERGECDFATDLAAPLPLSVICDILGIPAEDRARVGRWADVLAGAQDPEIAAALEGKDSTQAALELGTYAFQLGEKLDVARAPEVLARLRRSTLGGEPVDLATFSGLFVQILIGGNETTRSLLCGGVAELVRHPEQLERVAGDPSAIPAAVEEMLRWVTPVHYFRRTATRDTEVGGRRIRAGDRVALLYASANRDETVFAEPDRFDAARDPNPHVAFGFGEHFCLGARIARLEARVFLEELFRRFRTVELLGEPERIRSNQLNSTKRMPVRLVPR